MNTSYYRFTLDLDKQDSMECMTVRQGDTAKGQLYHLRAPRDLHGSSRETPIVHQANG